MQLNEFEELQNIMKESSPFLRSRDSFLKNANKMKFDSKLESKKESNIVSEKMSEKSVPR